MNLKALQVILLIIIGFLLFSIIYRSASNIINPEYTTVSKDEVTAAALVGEEVIANYRIVNPTDKPRLYFYEVYINNKKDYGNSVTVPAKRSFVFGGHFRFQEPGEFQIMAIVYDENHNLIKNTSDVVTIKTWRP